MAKRITPLCKVERDVSVSSTTSPPSTGSQEQWFTANLDSVDEGDTDFRGVVDSTLAHAMTKGRQVASQFGHADMDLEFRVWPTNPDNTEATAVEIKIEYMTPTPSRYAALHHLKSLEKLDDTLDVVDGDPAVPQSAVNPLLSTAIDYATTVNPENLPDLDFQPVRGSKIIRFTYDGSTPLVYRNSAYTVNLNSDTDTDVSDNYETKYYTLLSDSTTHFGVFPRYEAAVNGSEEAQLRVEQEWAFPISPTMVIGMPNSQSGVMVWNLDEGQSDPAEPLADNWLEAYYQTIKFENIVAIGGLVKVIITEVTSVGEPSQNNDFNINCNLTLWDWTKME